MPGLSPYAARLCIKLQRNYRDALELYRITSKRAKVNRRARKQQRRRAYDELVSEEWNQWIYN